MRLAAARARQRLGRRGIYLLGAGLGKVCLGVSYLTGPLTTVSPLTSVMPVWAWAWLWIVVGAAVFAGAWMPVGRDGPAFLVALVPPVAWAGTLLWAWWTGDYPRGAALWGWLMCGHVWVILWASTVPEHSVPPADQVRASDS
ncbi:hypothetical protein [Embleya sp. NPDC001921]